MSDRVGSETRHRLLISVNRQEVQLTGAKHSGLEVKQAAMAQGVAIQLDFQLSIRKDSGKFKVIGDDEVIKIDEGDVFRAVAHDDNS